MQHGSSLVPTALKISWTSCTAEALPGEQWGKIVKPQFFGNAATSQVDALQLVRTGSSVVLGIPTGQGKTLPLIAASLGTGKVGFLILPLLNLEGQLEKDLTRLGITFVNMSTSSAVELQTSLASLPPPEILLTNVEAVGDKAKRDVLRRSHVTIGHIAWDEAMVCF